MSASMWLQLQTVSLLLFGVICLQNDSIILAGDYFCYKRVKHVCFLSCESQRDNINVIKHLMNHDIRVSMRQVEDVDYDDVEVMMKQWTHSVGVLMDGACNNTLDMLKECSKRSLFDSMHMWLVVNIQGNYQNESTQFIDDHFSNLNLSVDADIVVAVSYGDHYKLVDIFNFGKIQGNHLETNTLGVWCPNDGLNISLKGFKYYNRWDFHNLTLRAVSVMLERPKVFTPALLEDIRYTPGVSAMTKVVSQILNILKERHNFRFNYTIVDRWVSSPQRNSTPAVTNSLFWREQDISATCLRIYPHWLDWMDPFSPPSTMLETKFYYLIPDKGVGEYENRLLSPLSAGVWLCACVACVACALVLTAAAAVERHPDPAAYGVCSVFAAVCQQAYEDGVQLIGNTFSSQSRRMTMLVIGATTMLMYNYYTSSVVSWLLSAAPPTIASLDGLIRSDLQLVFEDIGYTRGWFDNAGFYYYSGYTNPKEDELREKKVTKAKRKVALMQSVENGTELVRTGEFAYHSEPYTASQVIARRFSERELCELGALQMMPPSYVYIVGQKRSPYKQFFQWSLMRLLERGHTKAARARVGGVIPPCSGQVPRALALGQAAPAFALLLETYCLAVIILVVEILWHRFRQGSGVKDAVHAKNQRQRSIITHITHESAPLRDIKKQ